MKPKGVWGRASVALLGQGLQLLLGIAASIPVARGLGPSGKGDYAFHIWFAGCGALLLGWGWHSAIATLASEVPGVARQAVAQARRRVLPVELCLLLLSAGCFALGRVAWGCVALGTAAQVWGQPASGALLGQGRVGSYYLGLLAQSSVLFSVLCAFWRSNQGLTVSTALIAFAAGAVSGMLLHSTLCHGLSSMLDCSRSAAPGFEPQRLSALARSAWSANLAAFLTYRLDVLVVRWFVGPSGLGIYSTAVTVAELGRMAPNAMTQAALRPIGQASPKQRDAVARTHMWRAAATATVCMLGICLASSWAITAAYGADFASAAPLVLVLAPGVVALAVASVGAAALNVSGLHRLTARCAWAGTGAASVSALVLVPLFGGLGAAAASTLSYATQGALVWITAAARLRVFRETAQRSPV